MTDQLVKDNERIRINSVLGWMQFFFPALQK